MNHALENHTAAGGDKNRRRVGRTLADAAIDAALVILAIVVLLSAIGCSAGGSLTAPSVKADNQPGAVLSIRDEGYQYGGQGPAYGAEATARGVSLIGTAPPAFAGIFDGNPTLANSADAEVDEARLEWGDPVEIAPGTFKAFPRSAVVKGYRGKPSGVVAAENARIREYAPIIQAMTQAQRDVLVAQLALGRSIADAVAAALKLSPIP